MPSKIGFTEFVIIISCLMGLTAFSIDNLLPAFDTIARHFELSDPNQAQLLLLVFMASFAIMQLFYGPLSDRFKRKPILLIGLAIYFVGALVGGFATDFTMLLTGRFLQGIGAAAPRALTVAIVRDRYAGREMARILSLTMMVFILVPIIAPTIGSTMLLIGSWRLVFFLMALFSLLTTIWVILRLPETLPETSVRQSVLSTALKSLPRIFSAREPMVNTTAMSLMMGCLMTYLVSAPEIFETGIYNLGFNFAFVFAIIAFCMGAAAFTNSKLVRHVGMHRLSQIGLSGFLIASAVLLAEGVMFSGKPPLGLLIATLAVAHFLFSLTVPNLNAIAMEPLGDIAGTAASFIGFYSTLISAAVAFVFGAAFNGTILPLAICYFAMAALSFGLLGWLRANPGKPPVSA